ncbi:MAG TPA: four helix bundle protein [Thermoanaerobaculia bacterium]|nr:four helix bundle protein [Thermoanaerobaculia bacterium]
MKDIRDRAFEFACRIIRLHRAMTRKRGTDRVAANQLLRSGTSIGSNLEEAEAAQSRPDFIAKNRIALKEARESHYWLRIIAATEMIAPKRVHPLVEEANEIVAILTTIVKKASLPKATS